MRQVNYSILQGHFPYFDVTATGEEADTPAGEEADTPAGVVITAIPYVASV